jgi:hypothetical protein
MLALLRLQQLHRSKDRRFQGMVPGTDVMILKIFSPKNFAEKIGVFDSKQSQI